MDAAPHDERGDLVGLTRELCAFRTGVVAGDNAALFARIGEEIPLEVHRYPSGAEHNGWVVPPMWRVEEAVVEHDGAVVLDGSEHALAVAALSRPFEGTLSLDRLRPHLVSDAARPDAFVFHCAWQYRPWEASWALSVPHARLRTWPDGEYRVRLRTTREPGDMLVGVHEHRGAADRTVVFAAHTCHPHQANDGMVGVATLVRLFRWLSGRRTRHTYRLVLGPEHLGTVFYLRDRPPGDLDRMACGLFVEMTGVDGPLRATSTFLGGRPIDRAVAHVLRHGTRAHVLSGWREGAGNDETVWEAPGYEVPFVELTRCLDTFDPYPEYHSSLDAPDRLDPARVDEAYAALVALVELIEDDCVAHRRFDGLIALSNPRYDLYARRPDPAIPDGEAVDLRWGALMDRVLRRLDGRTTALEMADEVGLPFAAVRAYLGRMEERGLARLEPVLMPARVAGTRTG